MEAEKFLRKWKRMCKAHEQCTECPAFYLCGVSAPKDYVPGLIQVVTGLAEDHPQKTRLSEFLEKYPDAPKREDGIPMVCAAAIGYGSFCSVGIYHKNCRECWNQPLE